MKYRKRLLCAALAAMLLAGCSGRPADLGEGGGASPAPSSQASAPAASSAGDVVFTDALGYQVELHSWQRVVSLYGSFAETWVLAGGALAGTTSDAVEERGLQLGEEVAVVGSIKSPTWRRSWRQTRTLSSSRPTRRRRWTCMPPWPRRGFHTPTTGWTPLTSTWPCCANSAT